MIMNENMENEQIDVSVFCLAYNHERYIRDCLEGFVMQKTNFRFEVLIHDDASTDKTADIIREYEQKYPNIIKPIYQKENQYSQGIKVNKTYQMPRAKGKYIAFCEGDDYWTDPLKLQKQYDALEMNANCVLCSHIVQMVEADTKKNTDKMPEFEVPVILTGKQYIQINMEKGHFLQTSSYFIRKELLSQYYNEKLIFRDVAGVGDAPLLLWLATEGDNYIIQKEMSCYRQSAKGSWSRRMLGSPENRYQYYINMYNMYWEFNKYTKNVYYEFICKQLKHFLKNIYAYQQVYKFEVKNLEGDITFTIEEKKLIKRRARKFNRIRIIKQYFSWLMPLIKRIRKIIVGLKK